MKYMLMIWSNEAEYAALPDAVKQEGMGAYFAYTKALREAGMMVAGEPLHPSSMATTVKVREGKSQVLDGPYADTKEQVAGYYVIEAPDLDTAIAWATRCPGAHHGTMEVRPIISFDPA